MLDGKPLIYYAIQAGKESKFIDRIVVSTDDAEIAEIAKKYGAEVPFMRPKELAGDNITQYPPTEHAILELQRQGWLPDIVVFLSADVPLKTGKDVDRVVTALINSNVDSVRSVCEASTPPHWMCTLEKDNMIKRFVNNVKKEDPKFCIRQNLPKVYQITSIIDASWTKTITDTNTLFGNKIKACVFDVEKSIDIDTPLDLLVAETIIKNRKKIKK